MENNNHELNVKQKIRSKNNKKYILSFSILIVMIVLTFYLLFREYTFKELRDVLKNVNMKYILVAMTMPLFYILFQSLSTKTILKTLGEKTSLLHNAEYNAIDMYFSAITPSSTGGQPMALYYMVKDDVPSTKSIAALLLNTAAFKVILLGLGVFALIFEAGLLFGSGIALPILFFIGILINVIIVLICLGGIYHINMIRKCGYGILKFINKFRKKDINIILEKFELKLSEYEQCGKFIQAHKKLFIKVLFWNLCQRVSFFSISFFIYKSFGLSGVGIIQQIVIQVMISISVDSLPIPGGVLITETLMLRAYEQIYIEELILPAMLLTRLTGYYLLLIITTTIFIIKHIKTTIKGNRRNKAKENLQEN